MKSISDVRGTGKTTPPQWLTVTPAGLKPRSGTPRPAQLATVVAVSRARTLWRNRKPECRSYDGIESIHGLTCAECPAAADCLEQAIITLDIDGQPYRLTVQLQNLEHLQEWLASRNGNGLAGARVRLTVSARRSSTGRPWGELFIQSAD